MIRTGQVKAVKDGMLKVCFERPEACARCGACAGGRHNTLVSIPGNARVGDFVDVEMPDAQVLRVSALMYMIPLAALLLGMWLGSLLFDSEVLWALCGVILMALSWFILHQIDKRARKKAAFQPKIIAVYTAREEEKK